MTLINQITDSLPFHNMVIKNKAGELTHEDSMRQLPFPGNCMNWNLGHLLVYRIQILDLINGTSESDEAEFAIYGAGSDLLTDSSKAIPLDQLLTRLEESANAVTATLEKMPLERLDEVIDEERGTTMAQRLGFYMLFHEAYHIGQLELLHELALSQK